MPHLLVSKHYVGDRRAAAAQFLARLHLAAAAAAQRLAGGGGQGNQGCGRYGSHCSAVAAASDPASDATGGLHISWIMWCWGSCSRLSPPTSLALLCCDPLEAHAAALGMYCRHS